MSPAQFPVLGPGLISRRAFVSTSLAWAALSASHATTSLKRNPSFVGYPFELGVASGDPSPDGFVLWTRLAPQPLIGGGMPADPVEVRWEVAEDERFQKVVRRGTTTARPEWAHSVHVEIAGLNPDRWYFYRFKAGRETSPSGRSRTMPPLHSMPARLRFAFASCQHYETGFFTAYDHMVNDHPDLVVHLGDYIYEAAGRDLQIRKHVGGELRTLDDYRNRHAQYRMDPSLQAIHAAAPWILTWDDHEFANNCAGAISERKEDWPVEYLHRRACAYQAYYEHMPLRRSSIPSGPDMRLFRRIPFGRLAEFFVLDTRQHRTDQPCDDGNKPPCDAVFDPNATLLGPAQANWLFRKLKRSTGVWNVLAQQVMMARVDRTPGEPIAYSMDQWPGYEMERRRVLRFFRDQPISNPIVLGGDIHSNWANELSPDFDSPDAKPVASEFVGTSISSGGDGADVPKEVDRLLSENPFVKFHNTQRGYVRCEVTPRQWKADFAVMDFVTRRGGTLKSRASFVVENGRPGLQRG